ncbi:D-cysteine desulfhydrase [Ranunculus cassubicifolius]
MLVHHSQEDYNIDFGKEISLEHVNLYEIQLVLKLHNITSSSLTSTSFSILHHNPLPIKLELWVQPKVRKLEFLMADAIKQGADCVITIGGIQSNHCRTTAVAAKYLSLDCYLILGTSQTLVDKDPGLTGNLLVERLVGAHVDLISIEQYYETGGEVLTNMLKERLISEGRRPYVIPLGGSNSLGTWGYIEAIRELEEQLCRAPNNMVFQDIVVACGSGGTIAGLSLGSWLSSLKAKVHAFSVSEEFHQEEGYMLTPSSKLLLKNSTTNISPFLSMITDPAIVTPFHFMSTDEECVKILKRCREAIPSKDDGGKVIIIDIVIDCEKGEFKSTESQLCFDILMMVVVTGKERSETEWEKLFQQAGFTSYKITHALGLRSIIEVFP